MSVVHGSGGTGSGQIPLAGISDNSTKYIVYPNPSNDIINIDLRDKNNAIINETTVLGELYDLQGNSKSKVQIIDNKATVNVKNLQKGIYILKIDIDGQIESHQIIVQ